MVSTVPTARNKKIDTSAPMETGMVSKDEGAILRGEGDQRIVDLELQAVYRGRGKGKWSLLERVRAGMEKDTKVADVSKMQIQGGGELMAEK